MTLTVVYEHMNTKYNYLIQNKSNWHSNFSDGKLDSSLAYILRKQGRNQERSMTLR